MVDLFPSTLDLLIPNFNTTTIIGALMVVLGVLGFAYLSKLGELLPFFNPNKLSFFLVTVGLTLIWGVSIIQDFVTTPGGYVVTIGTIMVIVVGFNLFYNPGNAQKRNRGLLE